MQVGPRLELELVKIQEGLATGTVLYHRYNERSKEQTEEQQDAVEEAHRLRAERRRQQEENVQRKAMEQKREQLAQQVLLVCVLQPCGTSDMTALHCVHHVEVPCLANSQAMWAVGRWRWCATSRDLV